MTSADIARLARHYLARIGYLHLQVVEARTATVLQMAGIFKRIPPTTEDASLAAILTNTSHPLRVAAKAGPLLIHRASDDSNAQFAVDVSAFIFSYDVASRSAALAHFERLASNDMLTNSTSQILRSARELLLDDR